MNTLNSNQREDGFDIINILHKIRRAVCVGDCLVKLEVGTMKDYVSAIDEQHATLAVINGGRFYSFTVSREDFDDVDTLIEFMKAHINNEVQSALFSE